MEGSLSNPPPCSRLRASFTHIRWVFLLSALMLTSAPSQSRTGELLFGAVAAGKRGGEYQGILGYGQLPIFGIAIGWTTQQAHARDNGEQVQRAALAECRANGGKDCEVLEKLPVTSEDLGTIPDQWCGMVVYWKRAHEGRTVFEFWSYFDRTKEMYPEERESGARFAYTKCADKRSAGSLSKPRAMKRDTYGAISFSQESDGGYVWGMSWSYDSQREAKQFASNACRNRGGTNCRDKHWFRNVCGALALGGSNGNGSGHGNSQLEAERAALGSCRKVNQTCKILNSVCNQSGKRGRTASGKHVNKYGAISFSQESEGGYVWGMSWSYDSEREAKQFASRACRNRGGTECDEPFGFRNGCGALVLSGSNGYSMASRENTGEAERVAIEACRKSNKNCRLLKVACNRMERRGETTSAKHVNKFGAIMFYSKTWLGGHAWGMSWSHDSEGNAIQRAWQECNKNVVMQECQEILRFQNTCAAIAVGAHDSMTGGEYGIAYGGNLARVRQDALSRCQNITDNCSIVEARCSTDGPSGVSGGGF